MNKQVMSLEDYAKLTDEEREVLRQEEANAFLKDTRARLKADLEADKSKSENDASSSVHSNVSAGRRTGRFVVRDNSAPKGRVRGYYKTTVVAASRTSSKPMTKTQLVAALAEEMETDVQRAASALDAIAAIVIQEIAAGGAVTLPGIGKIYCRERPERMVRNPATGEQIRKETDKVIKMTIAKALKDSING